MWHPLLLSAGRAAATYCASEGFMMVLNFSKVEFLRSAARCGDFLRDGRPQFAFAGRSNVGKSSVINRLAGRKNLAYVGASPDD